MKTMRWMAVPALVLLLVVCMITSMPRAEADAKLMENGSVTYAFVSDRSEITDYVNENGNYSSFDTLTTDWKCYGNTYKIILDEPGVLYVYPLSNSPSDIRFCLYSNFQLTSELVKESFLIGTGKPCYEIKLDAGSYWYRAERWNGTGTVNAVVYFGFSSASNNRSLKDNSEECYDVTTYGEVQYAIVCDGDELADYIHHNIAYSSQDIITTNWKGSTDIYQISIDQPGYLIFAPIQINQDARLYLYSNNALTSCLMTMDYIDNINQERFYGLEVEPGTYYYCSKRWNATGDLKLSVYIGFVPSDKAAIDVNSYLNATISETDYNISFTPDTVENIHEFVAGIENRQPDFQDTINTSWSGNGDLHGFTLPESGLVYIWSTSGKNGDFKFNLYNDRALNSRIIYGKEVIEDKAKVPLEKNVTCVYLDAGTYYYQVYRWNDMGASTIESYFAFTPSSSILTVESIDLSQDKKTATIRFSINDAYNPDQQKALIRIEKGRVTARSADYNGKWDFETLENAIESHEYIAKENGIYTARIAGNGLQTHLCYFEVTGLEDTSFEQKHNDVDVDASQNTEESTTVEEPETTEEPQSMNASEMRRYIHMLEDQIEDVGLELPEFSAEITQEQYMRLLEQVLRDNGYDF